MMAAMKTEHDEESQAFLPPSRSRETLQSLRNDRALKASSYLRLIVELLMALAIAVLLLRPIASTCSKPLKPTPVPSLPRKIYKFVEDPKYLHDDMFVSKKETLHTLHKWIELSSGARGYVHIPDWEARGLNKPYTVQLNQTDNGPGYMVSVFHQLHCLSYLVQQFQTGYSGVELTDEVAHHSVHCFDYLRQSIMCSADTSLEGETEAGPGWGSEHECTDYDALLEWANDNSAYVWRTLMPEESVL